MPGSHTAIDDVASRCQQGQFSRPFRPFLCVALSCRNVCDARHRKIKRCHSSHFRLLSPRTKLPPARTPQRNVAQQESGETQPWATTYTLDSYVEVMLTVRFAIDRLEASGSQDAVRSAAYSCQRDALNLKPPPPIHAGDDKPRDADPHARSRRGLGICGAN